MRWFNWLVYCGSVSPSLLDYFSLEEIEYACDLISDDIANALLLENYEYTDYDDYDYYDYLCESYMTDSAIYGKLT